MDLAKRVSGFLKLFEPPADEHFHFRPATLPALEDVIDVMTHGDED
jgi:hypothetical protein